jgi:pimeloyl-ACP methyl ester carboxylesterase
MRGAEWREQRVAVRDAKLALYRRGAGRPFYWGHGLTSSSVLEARVGLKPWDAAPDGWEVIRWDARGHGASTGAADPGVYRWPELAADLLALADRLGHERFVLGGASMGTAVSLTAAVAAPERVLGLVLMIPPTAWETRAAQSDKYRTSADLAERDGIEALVAAELASPPIPIFAGLFDREQMARARAEALDVRVVPSIVRGAAASDLPEPAAVAKLPQPVLILAWRGDEGHPLSSAEALARLLPQAELLVADRLADLAAWPKRVARSLDEVGASV